MEQPPAELMKVEPSTKQEVEGTAVPGLQEKEDQSFKAL